MANPQDPDTSRSDDQASGTRPRPSKYDYCPRLPVQKLTLLIHQRRSNRSVMEQDLGWTTQRINRWETVSGEPSATQIYQIARYFDVSLEYLCDPDWDVEAEPPGYEGSRIESPTLGE